MKKILVAMLALLLCVLTGCSSQPAVESTLSTPLADLVAKHYAGAENLIRFGALDIEDVIGVTKDEYTDAVFLQDADISVGREVIVMRGVDSAAAQQIEKRLENYLTQRRKETQNYFPESYKLLSETSVQRKNNTVALVVNEKAADITKLLLAGE